MESSRLGVSSGTVTARERGRNHAASGDQDTEHHGDAEA